MKNENIWQAVEAAIPQGAGPLPVDSGDEFIPLHALDAHALALMQFKIREVILDPWLHTQDLCMIFAARGIGKTHFAMSVAYAIATAGKFAKWSSATPRRVLYLDGELPGAVMQKRLLMHCPDVEPEPGYLRIFTPDLLPDGRALPDLATYEGQAAIDDLIEDAEVVFVDNLSCWARSGRENEAESWLPIADWILSLRRRGIAVVLVHHAGKGGQQRGTSKREDLLDVVIGLSRPKDYEPSQGAVFVAEFTKARNLMGSDAESLELQLGGDDDRAVWTWRTVESSTYDRVVALTKEGLTPGEICAELDINKSNVSRHLRKARELAALNKAVRQWVAVSEACSKETSGFYGVALEHDVNNMLNHMLDGSGLVDAASNATVVQIDEALRGINVRPHCAFNYVRRKHHDEPQLVADDSRNSGMNLLQRMRQVARAERLSV